MSERLLVLGPFRVKAELGRGAMGVVYEAIDTRDGRSVALKVLRPEGASAVRAARFVREIAVMQRLSHPSIARILDAGTANGVAFYAMELLRGPTLADRMKEGAPREELLSYVIAVARGLDAAHKQGIVHRDVKAENVLLGSDMKARLADFGLARDLASEDRLTRSHALVGTPRCMAPEQIGGGTVDARTDVYALGVLLYQAIAGVPPFEARSILELAAILEGRDAEAPSRRGARERRAAADDRYDAVCLRALSRDPAARFADAGELAAALDLARSAARATPRTRLWLALVLLIVVGAGAALAVALRPLPPPPPDPGPSLALAESLLAAGDRGAEAAAEKARALAPPGSAAGGRAAGIVGLARLRGGDAAGALEALRAGADSGPDVLLGLAQVENALGLPAGEAVVHAESALAAAPSLAAQIEAAKALERDGKPESACAHYESALKLSPDDVLVLTRFASVLLELHRAPRAIPLLRTAVALAPGDASAFTDLGTALFQTGDVAGAEAAFRDAVAIDPANRYARNGLAAALIESDRFAEAEPILDGLVRDAPSLAGAWGNLARTRRRLGKLDLAADAVSKARALEPTSSEHAKEAGRLALATLHLAEAEIAFADAARLDPDDAEAVLDLAAVMAQKERVDDARSLLEKFRVLHAGGVDPRIEKALAGLGR